MVRKKLNWNYKPFEIPSEIRKLWKEIGDKASVKAEKDESKHQKEIKKFGWLGRSITNHKDQINQSMEKVIKNYLKNFFTLGQY